MLKKTTDGEKVVTFQGNCCFLKEKPNPGHPAWKRCNQNCEFVGFSFILSDKACHSFSSNLTQSLFGKQSGGQDKSECMT